MHIMHKPDEPWRKSELTWLWPGKREASATDFLKKRLVHELPSLKRRA
jgi:hypothetical protein